jgi:hypothetical protein
MTVGTNSYGNAAQVAILTKRFTVNGSFTTTSTPTLTEVEGFLDTVSAWLNTALAKNGFVVPVTQADVKTVLAGMAVEAAGDLVCAANSSGRFFTEKALERGLDPLRVLRRELSDAIEEQASGFEALGASRTESKLGTIGFKDGDESGDEVSPLFERKAFGNKNREWDATGD